MTDRELLELAAKAAGKDIDLSRYDDAWGFAILHMAKWWNPLTDDGDALRLAVKLRLDISFGNRYYFDEGPMTFCGTYWSSGESSTMTRFVKHEADPMDATRRAIVRAAAEIGKETK